MTSIARTPDDVVTDIAYGDAAHTASHYDYDTRRDVTGAMTYRGSGASWPTTGLNTYQLTLEDTTFAYDGVSNPVQINDNRVPEEWPSGAKPVNRCITYDDFYRVASVSSTYAGVTANNDPWQTPYADEDAANSTNPLNPQAAIDSRRALPTPQVTFTSRPKVQTFAYDSLGNGTSSTATGFYDRSLGTITNGTANAGPYQLQRASITTGTHSGSATAQYDAAGNMVALNVDRNGACTPTRNCSQSYKYEWDELGRLTRVSRRDFADLNPAAPPLLIEAADLRYRYDADDDRVIKTATDLLHASQRHTVYIFDSLELRRANYLLDYDQSAQTEVPYLFANGVRLARVVYEPNIPQSASPAQHIFFELGDHLGSTSTVLDKATGELVEKATYQAYGATESDYRPGRWSDFREDYRFTGKEEDVEVGIQYFGKRFYGPALNRWMNPDPAGLHDAGSADLNLYAYVHGQALKNVDPLGLDETTLTSDTNNANDAAYAEQSNASNSSMSSSVSSYESAAMLTSQSSTSLANSSAALRVAGIAAGQGIGVAGGQVPLLGPAAVDAVGVGVSAFAPTAFQNGFGEGLISSAATLQMQAGSEGSGAGAAALTGLAAPEAAVALVHAGSVEIAAANNLAVGTMMMAASSSGGSSSSPEVQKGLDMIEQSGAKVQVNPKAPNQEGNVTLDYGEKGRVNVRVETHPLKPGGPPVRHANIETVKDVQGRPIKEANIHVMEK